MGRTILLGSHRFPSLPLYSSIIAISHLVLTDLAKLSPFWSKKSNLNNHAISLVAFGIASSLVFYTSPYFAGSLALNSKQLLVTIRFAFVAEVICLAVKYIFKSMTSAKDEIPSKKEKLTDTSKPETEKTDMSKSVTEKPDDERSVQRKCVLINQKDFFPTDDKTKKNEKINLKENFYFIHHSEATFLAEKEEKLLPETFKRINQQKDLLDPIPGFSFALIMAQDARFLITKENGFWKFFLRPLVHMYPKEPMALVRLMSPQDYRSKMSLESDVKVDENFVSKTKIEIYHNDHTPLINRIYYSKDKDQVRFATYEKSTGKQIHDVPYTVKDIQSVKFS